MTRIEQLNDLLENNVSLQQKISETKDPETIRSLLAEGGVDLTKEEMEEMLIEIGRQLNVSEQNTNLTEDDLEKVTGGFGAATGAFILGCVGGGILGIAAVGALAYGGWYLYTKLAKK